MTASFNAFMKNTVNINQHRLVVLETSVPAIYDALEGDDTLGPFVTGYDPQGSWCHETIIKPAEGVEFDADFMLVLNENPDWSANPKRYLTEVRAALRRHGIYQDLVKPTKCRCVRVAYSGDYHVDVVPYLVLADGRQVIVNGDEDDWEDTDPAAFTAWMKQQNDITNGHLKQVIRLLKYLRDHRANFRRTRSVLITATLGEQVDAAKKIANPAYYEDLPTTFLHLIADLNEWLQARPTKPSIPDPSGVTDPYGSPVTFDHRWTPETYLAYRDKIATIAEATQLAYHDETSIEHSLELWQRVFGPDFKDPSPSGGSGSGAAAGGLAGLSSVSASRGG
jgi:hypothetical protein